MGKKDSESPWTREICRGLERRNAQIFCIVGSMMQKSGWPDRYVHHAYWRGWIEFKSAQRQITELQRRTCAGMWRRQPGSAYFLRFPGTLTRPSGHVVTHDACDAESLIFWLQRDAEIISDDRQAMTDDAPPLGMNI